MIDPRSNETTGYHLFLEPEGSLKEELQKRIDILVENHGGPTFPPHVTLLARIEADEADVLARAQTLAETLSPITLTLGSWGRGTSFFNSVFIRIEETPDLIAAHANANEVFGMQDEAYYSPHLSLFYGLTSDEQRRAMILDVIYPEGASWNAASLHVYKTNGPTRAWQEIAVYPFGA